MVEEESLGGFDVDDKNLYSQLTTKTLDSVSSTDIATQTGPIHLEKSNEEILRSTVLLNYAAGRTGTPIPGTSKVVAVVSDDSGTKFLADKPGAGETWMLYGFGVIGMNGRSGNVEHSVYTYDGSNYSYVCYDGPADSSFPFSNQAGFPVATIDENTQIAYAADGTFTDSTLTYTAVQVN